MTHQSSMYYKHQYLKYKKKYLLEKQFGSSHGGAVGSSSADAVDNELFKLYSQDHRNKNCINVDDSIVTNDQTAYVLKKDVYTVTKYEEIGEFYNILSVMYTKLLTEDIVKTLSDFYNVNDTKLQFTNVLFTSISDVIDFLGLIRHNDDNTYYYKKTLLSISNIPLATEQLTVLAPFIQLLEKQQNNKDTRYISDPFTFVSDEVPLDDPTFQDICIYKHFFARQFQDGLTELLNNYSLVAKTDNPNELYLKRGHKVYIKKLMKIINNIKTNIASIIENDNYSDNNKIRIGINFILRNMYSDNDRPTLELNHVKQELKKIELRLKGGNAIKIFLNDFTLDDNTYSLNDDSIYDKYLKELSDFDFDIYYKYDSDIDKLKYLQITRIYMQLLQGELRATNDEYKDLKTYIQCYIELIQKNYETHTSLIVQSHGQHTEMPPTPTNSSNPRHPPMALTRNTSAPMSTTLSCSIGDFCTESETLVSFDLLRMVLKLNIPITTEQQDIKIEIPTKVEVFDFGLSHMDDHVKQSLTDPGHNKFLFKIPDFGEDSSYLLHIKSPQFLVYELLYITLKGQDLKTEKRLTRLFNIIKKCQEKNIILVNNELFPVLINNNKKNMTFIDAFRKLKEIHPDMLNTDPLKSAYEDTITILEMGLG